MLVFEAIASQIWRGILICKLQTMIATMIQTKRVRRFPAAWACEGGSISFYVPCHFVCCRALQLKMWTSDLTTGLYIVCWIYRGMQKNKKRKFKTKNTGNQLWVKMECQCFTTIFCIKHWNNKNLSFQQLLQQRKGSQCRHDGLSKQIRKHIRQRLRERRNLRTERILTEFVQLNRLDEVHHDPAKQYKKCGAEEQLTPHKFAEYLQGTFALEIPTPNLQPRSRNGGEGANVLLNG